MRTAKQEAITISAAHIVRFWAKVNKDGPIPTHCPELGACWIWTASCNVKGYGKLNVNGKHMAAHRIAFFLEHGRCPTPCGLHRCDNPLCVRPSHIREGTQLENVRDCITKGRDARGERNGSRLHPERRARGDRHGSRTHPERLPRGEDHARAKLTVQDVIEVRRLAVNGLQQRSIASRFGVCQATVRDIVARKIWRHVA
jgi:hypothetical protein